MDFPGYAALGGLERLTIVAGAVIIGYWGYRLYIAEKSAGLVFMGLAVIVLVGALATGGSYVRSVGEGYQLASLPVAPAEAPASAPAAPEPPLEEAVGAPPPAPEASAAGTAFTPAVPAAPEAPAAEPPAAVTAQAEAEPAAEPPAPIDDEAVAEAETSPVRLATGQELGGRIVSVKSENVSLEWSSDSD